MNDPSLLPVASTGINQFASAERMSMLQDSFEKRYAYAVKSKTHLWNALTSFVLSDETLRKIDTDEPISLDLENMLMPPQIGCYVCEESFRPELLTRKCKGEPRVR